MDGARRKFRWKKWMTVLLGIAAAIFLYVCFLNGTLPVDAAIVNEENLEKIAANWDRLLASERFGSWDGKGADTQLLYYRHEDGGNEPVLVGYIGINESGFSAENRKFYLEYERTGLLDALQGMGRLGECCVTLCGVSEHCVVWILDYDADGTDRAYKPIREALEIIDGSAG